MTIRLKTGAFLRWIRAIWLTALLAAFGLLEVVSSSAFPSAPLSFGYDGHNQARIAYDGSSPSAFNYNSAAVLTADGRESPTARTGHIFANFAEFLAADSTLAGSIRGVNPTGGTMNCVNCSIATDATLAGSPASALPGSPTSISVLENTFGGTFQPVSDRCKSEASCHRQEMAHAALFTANH